MHSFCHRFDASASFMNATSLKFGQHLDLDGITSLCIIRFSFNILLLYYFHISAREAEGISKLFDDLRSMVAVRKYLHKNNHNQLPWLLADVMGKCAKFANIIGLYYAVVIHFNCLFVYLILYYFFTLYREINHLA